MEDMEEDNKVRMDDIEDSIKALEDNDLSMENIGEQRDERRGYGGGQSRRKKS